VVAALRSLSDNVSIHHLQDILISPAYQGKGFGKQMLNMALEHYAHVRTHLLLTDDEECPFESLNYKFDVGLQLVSRGSKFEFFLTFRDKLNSSDILREKYNQLKNQCSSLDHDEYRKVKSEFIESVLSGHIIRRAEINDALGIHDAHMKSIQKICSKDHSKEEIAAWGHCSFNNDNRINAILNHIVFVIETDDNIEGYGHLKFYFDNQEKKAHLMGLYLTPKVAKKGLGSLLLSKLLAAAKKEAVTEVTLESTLTSKSFYLKHQAKIKNDETTILINGIPIRCIPMSLKI
jgi:GNAT superfamily N-acetyltransferase